MSPTNHYTSNGRPKTGGKFSNGERFSNGDRYLNGGERYSNGGERYSNGGERYSNGGERYSNGGERYSNGGERYSNGGYSNGRQQRSSPVSYNQSPTSSPNKNNDKYERGVIEKLLNSYGFVECVSNNQRVFFHYSQYNGNAQDLIVGDCMEFELSNDPRNGKLIAVRLQRLQPGSVVIETLSEEQSTGRVEVEAKPARNGEFQETQGRVSYDRNGEFFFLPFAHGDIEKGQTICKGDTVAFHVATNKRTGAMKARKLRYQDPENVGKKVQGIISSLKETFGFIERSDMVAEIFFHYSEFNGEISEAMIGDDVEFKLFERQGKDIAIKVNKLAAGTVVFEDISTDRHRGHVIKSVNMRSGNSIDGHLTGMIEYQGQTDTHEVLFGDRDTEDEICLQKGDVVEFNISTDRRDKLQRAVNIKLVSVSMKSGQVRETGAISSLKDGFGFIKCADRDLSIFFHFSEVVEQSHIIGIGDEVEFGVEEDPISRRQHATRIRFLPKGTVCFEVVSKQRMQGIVEREAPSRTVKSPSKLNKDLEFGCILAAINGVECEVLYRGRDCSLRGTAEYKDVVEFTLVTRKSNNAYFAREVSIIVKNEVEVQYGYVCALKESFGFIELEDHSREVFFHYSELDGDPNDLELGDEVEFIETRKCEKPSAEKVVKLVPSTPDDELLPAVYDGSVVRPMRIIDPEQDEYEGLVQVCGSKSENSSDRGSGDERRSSPEQGEYTFGITSLIDKREHLHAGDKVLFQLCIDKLTGKMRACNIQCNRTFQRGRVESIKGAFGFISHNEAEDGKSLFFHMSEVEDDNGITLQPGDEVKFVIVKSHKNAKRSAVKVQKVTNERPEHLSRRRSQRLMSECSVSKFTVVRQPSGPDGSGGFKLRRGSSVIEQVVGGSPTTSMPTSPLPLTPATEIACA